MNVMDEAELTPQGPRLSEMPTEILLHIFKDCSSIATAINLSLTCQRLYHLLRTSQKIPVLFAIAERVWGPLEDVYQIITYNAAQPVHVKRTPLLSFALLVQVSQIGRVASWYEEIYPKIRWDGSRSEFRRKLNSREARSLRRAIYRKWLFDRTFHTPATGRLNRMTQANIASRSQLLRTWSTNDLFELEDARIFVEALLTNICPTNGEVFWRTGSKWLEWGRPMARSRIPNLFHDMHNDSSMAISDKKPASEVREQTMEGWGDEIEQYHALAAMSKLDPSQIMVLYETAFTKDDVESYVHANVGGYWFWDNGETMLDAWLVVMTGRGLAVQEAREKILCGLMGIAVDS